MKLCIHIMQNDEGTYTASCPSLPGCVSRGSTREEARDRLHEAICGYIAAVGNFVPENIDCLLVEATP